MIGRGAPEPEQAQFPEHFPIDDLIGDDGAGWEQALRSEDRAEHRQDAGRVAHADSTGDSSEGETVSSAGEVVPEAAAQPGEQVAAAVGSAPAGNGAVPEADGSSEDVLSQISRLSPKAAEAIAAALGDEGDD
jgi:hypothetical protein